MLSDKTCEKSFGTFETNSALILSDGSDQEQLAKDIMALPDIAGVSRLSVTRVCRLCKLPDETSGAKDQNGGIPEGCGISLERVKKECFIRFPGETLFFLSLQDLFGSADFLRRRRLHALERIRNSKLFIFRNTHCMIRKDLHTLHAVRADLPQMI